MKKILFTIFLAAAAMNINAQLVVDSLGRVGVGTVTAGNSSILSVGTYGVGNYNAAIECGVHVDLVLKAGATLRIINGGVLEPRNSFKAPLGAKVEIIKGKIM